MVSATPHPTRRGGSLPASGPLRKWDIRVYTLGLDETRLSQDEVLLMFETLGRVVTRHPWRIIGGWLVAAVAVLAFSPALGDVTSADQASFLPDDSPSVEAQAFADRAFPRQGGGATAVFVVTSRSGDPLAPAQLTRVERLAADLERAGVDRVRGVLTGPEQLSPDGSAQLVQVSFDGLAQDEPVMDAVTELRGLAGAALAGSDLEAAMTGDAALMVDNQEAFSSAESITLLATLGLILGLLLAIFRSPVAALMPLVAVGLVFATATSLIALAAETLGFQAGAELTSLLIVVLFGIGTDYILFLLFRYRERLRAGDDARRALETAVARVGRVIGSAALVVIVSFSALLLSEFGSFTAMAPGLAIAVSVMLLAALTLVPAILAVIGPRVFWPSRRWQHEPPARVSARIGDLVALRPERAVLATGGVLVALAAGAVFYVANYDTVDGLPSGTESAAAFERLDDAFPAGALNPTAVYVRGSVSGDELAALRDGLSEVNGIAAVGEAQPAPGGGGAQVSVVLADGPYSAEALDTVSGPLRELALASPAGEQVLVGGVTAAFADVRDAVNRDLSIVFPVAAGLIGLILLGLLRAAVAPLVLLVAVALGFAATLGATVIVFQGLAGDPGLMFSLPIILYLFVVAIGTDYNILMIDRLREEAEAGHDARSSAALAIRHAGPTVAAAGVILAGTFAALMLTGVSLLVQLGFAVSVGIVLSAFVMAAVLVPALTASLGERVWWPRRPEPGRSAPPAGAEVAAAPRDREGDRVEVIA